MASHVYKRLFAYAVAALLVCPPLVGASAGKNKHTEERESLDVEHRTTHERQEVEPEPVPEFSRDADEQEGRHQEVTKERREIHRESREQEESHHHDD